MFVHANQLCFRNRLRCGDVVVTVVVVVAGCCCCCCRRLNSKCVYFVVSNVKMFTGVSMSMLCLHHHHHTDAKVNGRTIHKTHIYLSMMGRYESFLLNRHTARHVYIFCMLDAFTYVYCVLCSFCQKFSFFRLLLASSDRLPCHSPCFE